jgi:hypothetical protein
MTAEAFLAECRVFGYYGTPEGLDCLAAGCRAADAAPVLRAYQRRALLCGRVRRGELALAEAARQLATAAAPRLRAAPRGLDTWAAACRPRP